MRLLKDGLRDGRVEAQEYALWSLSSITDAASKEAVVQAGGIPPLIELATSGTPGACEDAAGARLARFWLGPALSRRLLERVLSDLGCGAMSEARVRDAWSKLSAMAMPTSSHPAAAGELASTTISFADFGKWWHSDSVT